MNAATPSTSSAKAGAKPKARNPRGPSAPPGETKAGKFVRLATPRVSKIIAGMESIGKLSARSYDFNEEQVKEIFEAIDAAVASAFNLFKVRLQAGSGERAEKGARFGFAAKPPAPLAEQSPPAE